MAFPSTPLLDNFNRSENPLSTDWAQGRQSATPLLANGSVAAASAPASGTPASSRRTDVTPLNAEAWVTISNLGGAGGSFATLIARQQTSGTEDYEITPGSGGSIAISDRKANVVTQRASALRLLGDGEKLGIQVAYSGAIVAVYGWLYTGGAWQTTPIVTWYDSAANRIVTAGDIELLMPLQTSGVQYDDFGGGETVVAPMPATLSGMGAPTGLRDPTRSLGYRGLGAFGSYTERVAKWQFNIGNSDGLASGYDPSVDGWRGSQNNQLVGFPISGDPLPGVEPVFSVAVGSRFMRSNARLPLPRGYRAQGTAGTMGPTSSVFSSSFATVLNRLVVGGTWTAPSSGLITKALGRLAGGASPSAIRAVIYADSGGLPDALLGTSDAITIPANASVGVLPFAFSTPISVTAGHVYWLGWWMADGNGGQVRGSWAGTTAWFVSSTYAATGPAPDPFPGGASSSAAVVPWLNPIIDTATPMTHYNLGIWPPVVIHGVLSAALPPVVTQLLAVYFSSQYRRQTDSRRFPLAGFDSAGPLLGPREPTVIFPAPFSAVIDVVLQAIAKRIADRRRAPMFEFLLPTRTGLPPPPVVTAIRTTLAARARLERGRRAPHSDLPPVVFQPPLFGPEVNLAPRARADLIRRRPGYRLAPPAVITPLPSREQTTLRIEVFPAVARLGRLRRAPHSALEPPQVVLPLPTLREQTIRTTSVAVRRRVEALRRGPKSELQPPAVVSAAPLAPPLAVELARSRRPAVHPHLFAPPALAAVALAPPLLVSPARTRLDAQRRRAIFRLNPPTVVLPLPTLREQTVKTTSVAVADRLARLRRLARFELSPAATLARAPLAPLEVSTVAVRTRGELGRRAPHALLGEPTAILPLPTLREQTLRVSLLSVAERTRPRHTISTLGAPQALQTFAGPKVALAGRTRAESLRRAPHSRLAPPAVITPLATLEQRTLRVYSLGTALRLRLEGVRRRPLSELFPPAVVLPTPAQREQTVRVTLAGRTRLEAVRRRPLSTLRPPQIILPLPTLREQTVKTTSVATRDRLGRLRRAPHAELGLPTTLAGPPLAPLRVTLAAARSRIELSRRAPHALLGKPTVILPLPALREQTIKVTLDAVRTRTEAQRREPFSHLGAPAGAAAKPLAPPAEATLAAVRTRLEAQRRATHSLLAEPAVVLPLPGQRAQTISTALAAVRTRIEQARHAPRSRLVPPRVLQTFAGPAVTLALRPRLEAARRAPHFELSAPVFSKPTLAQQTIETTLAAVRTRVELPRHAPHSRLGRPISLRLPAPILGGVALARTRAELARRAPHSHLSPPTVVAPPPTLGQQTIRVSLAALATRSGLGRRAPHSHIGTPSTLIPLPSSAQTTLRVTCVAVRTRVESPRRQPIWLLGPGSTTAGGTSALTILAASAATSSFLAASAAELGESAASVGELEAEAATASETETSAGSGSSLHIEPGGP